MIYSFFDVGPGARKGLGTYIILDHIIRAARAGLPYVYLGYWVDGSPRMAYKTSFRPLERLGRDGWRRMDDRRWRRGRTRSVRAPGPAGPQAPADRRLEARRALHFSLSAVLLPTDMTNEKPVKVCVIVNAWPGLATTFVAQEIVGSGKGRPALVDGRVAITAARCATKLHASDRPRCVMSRKSTVDGIR